MDRTSDPYDLNVASVVFRPLESCNFWLFEPYFTHLAPGRSAHGLIPVARGVDPFMFG